MLAYNDSGTYTFVLLYDGNSLTRAQASADVGSILRRAGVRRADGESLALDLAAVAAGAEFQNPTIATLAGGEVYVECKRLPGLGDPVIELQIGAACFMRRALFAVEGYTADVRDRLVEMVGDFAAIDGFLAGFTVCLGDDEDERHYRRWFAECTQNGRLSLQRLLNHDYLSTELVAVGPGHIAMHGRDVFLKCPAWRVLEPREDVICVFMDNVVWGSSRSRLDKVSHVREALAHLRRHLKDDASAGNEPQCE